MAGNMQAADAAGRISALLSLLALRRILAVLQPLLLLLLLPFRWRARQGDAALADAVAASVTGSRPPPGRRPRPRSCCGCPPARPWSARGGRPWSGARPPCGARGRPGGTTSSSPPPAARRCSRSPGARMPPRPSSPGRLLLSSTG